MAVSLEGSLRLLRKYKINYPRTKIVKGTVPDFHWPAVLKVDSPKVLHKSDMGLVFTGLTSKKSVKETAKKAEAILDSKNIHEYILVLQESVDGIEVIIGMKRDPTFGPVIVFGIGGVLVEAVKDVTMRVAPLSKKDCNEMLSEITGKKILDGYRGMPKVNKEKLVELLQKASKLAIENPEIVEFDFNPVIVTDKKATVVDARFLNA